MKLLSHDGESGMAGDDRRGRRRYVFFNGAHGMYQRYPSGAAGGGCRPLLRRRMHEASELISYQCGVSVRLAHRKMAKSETS